MQTLYYPLFSLVVIETITIAQYVSHLMFDSLKKSDVQRVGEATDGYEYEVAHEGRQREYEYKTIYAHAERDDVDQLQALLNKETEDGWKLSRHIDAHDIGAGTRPGVIFIFERPVRESNRSNG